jgi:hypothetical protein
MVNHCHFSWLHIVKNDVLVESYSINDKLQSLLYPHTYFESPSRCNKAGAEVPHLLWLTEINKGQLLLLKDLMHSWCMPKQLILIFLTPNSDQNLFGKNTL